LYQQPFSHPSTSSSGSGVCDPFATVASDDFSNLVLAYHFESFTIIKQQRSKIYLFGAQN
jgi:hypothetical protein